MPVLTTLFCRLLRSSSGKNCLKRLDILQLDFKGLGALMQKNNFLMGGKGSPAVCAVRGNWREIIWLKWWNQAQLIQSFLSLFHPGTSHLRLPLSLVSTFNVSSKTNVLSVAASLRNCFTHSCKSSINYLEYCWRNLKKERLYRQTIVHGKIDEINRPKT